MTKKSAKTNLLFETFYQDNFNIDQVYPTEEDFNFIKEAKADFEKNSFSAEAHHRPEVLAITMTDRNKIIRRLIAAIIDGWQEMVEAMKVAFERLGGKNNELKDIIALIKMNVDKITNIENKEEPQVQTQPIVNNNQSANAGVTNMGVSKKYCRLVIYDTAYNPPARRHLYIGKKVGNTYAISVGGSQFGPSHSWYDEPLFDSLQQAEDFIRNVNQTNIKTVVDTHNFKYNITDKPIDLGTYQGNKIQIADLSDAVLVNTACGPAYIQRKNKKCVESLQEKIVHLSNGDWQVQSEKGRNMGTYDTKKEAEKRLGQVEYFKHMNEDIEKVVYQQVRAYETKNNFDNGSYDLCEIDDDGTYFNELVNSGNYYAVILGDFSCEYGDDGNDNYQWDEEHDDHFIPTKVWPNGLNVSHLTENLIEAKEAKEENLEEKIRSVIGHKEDDDWHDGKAYLFEISDESKNSTNGNNDPFWIEKFDDDQVDFSKLTTYKRTKEELDDGKYVATFMISGGKNGSGNWVDYLSGLKDLFKKLQDKTGCEPLLYKVDTDICDDVWTGYVFMYDHIGNSLEESLKTSKKLLTEGCWGMPYTLEMVNKLKDLMQKPVDAFEVGDQVENKNKDLGIGDDELFDRISKYRNEHPYGTKASGDVRKVIQDFIKDEVLPNWDSYSYSDPKGDYEGHTWEPGVKEVFQEIANLDLAELKKQWEAECKKAQEDVPEEMPDTIEEDIEKHDTLNPKLFDGNKLKKEVKDKAQEVADEFIKILENDEVKIEVKDIILTGSNASYNYTKDSDIDLHILAKTIDLADPDKLYEKLYNAYRRLFESKFDISFYGIPVEIYVETEDNPVVSNGIYSIISDSWVKEPKEAYVPDIDKEAIKKAAEPWIERANELIDADLDLEDETEIDKYLEDLYKMRHKGIYDTNGSEFSEENLVFKEVRNAGLLDKLKELKNKVIENRLTLEALVESNEVLEHIDEKTRYILKNKIGQISHNQPIIQDNGLFEIYNVKADDVDNIIRELYRLNLIEFADKMASKYDFSKINFDGMPSRYYTIRGKVKL